MRQFSGMSLLELLVSLGILSLLLSISLPDHREFAESQAGKVTLRKLATAIQLGKTTAIASATTVTLCKSHTGLTCGGNWQDGVILFTDSNRDQNLNGDDRLVRHIPFNESRGNIRFRAFQNKQTLQISSAGTTHSQNGNFTYCPFSGSSRFARQLIVNRTARVRFAQDSDGDEIREDSRGRPLTCS